MKIIVNEFWLSFLFPRTKYVKCHDSPLYSCASLDTNISVTGDEDGFVKMWDNRLGDTSIMTFKRFGEFVSSFLKIDEHHLIAASGEGTIQSFDLRNDGELNCMGTVRSGTKLVVGRGTGPLYLLQVNIILISVIITLRYLPLSVLPSWSRSVCNIKFFLYRWSLLHLLSNSCKSHGTKPAKFE